MNNDKNKPSNPNESTDTLMGLLREVHAQNISLAKKIDTQTQKISELEASATRRGAVAGAVAGGVTSSAVVIGFELIRAKLGF